MSHPDEVPVLRAWIADLLKQNEGLIEHIVAFQKEDGGHTQSEVKPQTEQFYENMRWSLGLNPNSGVLGPDDEPRAFITPDGTRTNSCDSAREDWLLHCEEVGNGVNEVVDEMRAAIASSDGESLPDPETFFAKLETVADSAVATDQGPPDKEVLRLTGRRE